MSNAVPPVEVLGARLEKLVAERHVVGATGAILVHGEITEAGAGQVTHRTGVVHLDGGRLAVRGWR